jgi:lactaldehyde dehydrogenase/glycolaldehyde dehydrogenase
VPAFPAEVVFGGGEWTRPSGAPFDVLDPATEEVVATIGSATPEEAEAALLAARNAQPAWARTPAPARGALLRRVADVIDAHAEELATLLVHEVGKPIGQARGEVGWASSYVRYVAEWDRRIEGEIVPSDNEGEAIHLLRVPVGVVVAICAWNYPFAGFCRKVAPALVTGNTVVVKPSRTTPLASLRATQLIAEEVELPPGVLNVVPGDPATADALVASPLTNLVTMTGSTATGKRIMANAAANMTRVSLELGGKAPAIVWRDADLDLAVPALVLARHLNAGQVCTCAERVFVHEDVLDDFVSRYVEAVGRLRVGDPFDDVDMGPLVSGEQRDHVERLVETAVGDGAEVLLGGSRPEGPGFERGFWLEPTVLAAARPEMAVMRDEAFGPVTPIMGVSSLDQAIELANDSPYGLSSYLFTNDYAVAMEAESRLAFGELYVNRSLGEAMQAHHSGHRQSGTGGEDGKHGVLRYTQLKSVYHQYA